MKRTLIPLLLGLVLLCGCAARNSPPESPLPAATVPAMPSAPPRLVTASRQEGDLRTYALASPLSSILPWQEDLLLFSGGESAALSVLDTESMTIAAVWEAGFPAAPETAALQLLQNGLSCFDSVRGETVMLDHNLREIRRIPVPEQMTGLPLLSRNGRTLFYCTSDAVRALDLESGISRILKEAAYPVQQLSGLLLDDSVVQVTITDTDDQVWTLFLSAQTGQLLRQHSGSILPQTSESGFFLRESPRSILFGNGQGSVQTLMPKNAGAGSFYLPEENRALSVGSSGEGTLLQLYELDTGLLRAVASVSGSRHPQSVAETADGILWLLFEGEQALHRWDPAISTVSDSTLYTGGYYTRENPDYEGLAACSLLAQELGAKYGINILIYKDAAALEPWDYHLEYEHRADVLRQELEALDRHLGHFPAGFLQTLAGKFTDFTICIVQNAVGSPESGSLEAVNGIQFLDNFDAYIVLAASHDTQYALYHELSHLMETVVLTESVAYDRWDNLNPAGFQYDNDYLLNRDRDGSPWQKPGRESFVDTYAMSYAKEDRARIFEHAMTDGHEALFSSPNLQRKLRQMCIGIREAFELDPAMGPFLWEQYLREPLN